MEGGEEVWEDKGSEAEAKEHIREAHNKEVNEWTTEDHPNEATLVRRIPNLQTQTGQALVTAMVDLLDQATGLQIPNSQTSNDQALEMVAKDHHLGHISALPSLALQEIHEPGRRLLARCELEDDLLGQAMDHLNPALRISNDPVPEMGEVDLISSLHLPAKSDPAHEMVVVEGQADTAACPPLNSGWSNDQARGTVGEDLSKGEEGCRRA